MNLSKTASINAVSPDYLSKVSHDFKTPLNIILSSASLIQLKTSSLQKADPDIAKYIHYIEQNCHRLLRLVNTLLDTSRPDPHTPPLLTSRCELNSFLEYTLEDLTLYASHKNIELYFQSDLTEPCVMNVDRDQLERILINLISNALNHTPSGGTLLLSLHADSDFVYISVNDDGEGISEQFLPQLFKPYRTDARTATSTGTGLGLPIVKELVELHKGKILVSSSPGKGTRFCFSLSRHLPLTTEFSAVASSETELPE